MCVQIEAGIVEHIHKNIGTQSVQELFLCDRSIRTTVYSNDLFKFLGGCDVQQERNWEFIVHTMLHR